MDERKHAEGPQDASDIETYDAPTDPVVEPGRGRGPSVVGGFDATSMSNDPPTPRSTVGGSPDAALVDAIQRELREDAATNDLVIDVDVVDGVAHLRGKVEDLDDTDNAAAVAARVPGVVDVVDELEIAAGEGA